VADGFGAGGFVDVLGAGGFVDGFGAGGFGVGETATTRTGVGEGVAVGELVGDGLMVAAACGCLGAVSPQPAYGWHPAAAAKFTALGAAASLAVPAPSCRARAAEPHTAPTTPTEKRVARLAAQGRSNRLARSSLRPCE
jgi:hypothetical protein